MQYENVPLKDLLSDRKVFGIFDEEFRNGGWLDVTALLGSESLFADLYQDGTVPEKVLDRIKQRLADF